MTLINSIEMALLLKIKQFRQLSKEAPHLSTDDILDRMEGTFKQYFENLRQNAKTREILLKTNKE